MKEIKKGEEIKAIELGSPEAIAMRQVRFLKRKAYREKMGIGDHLKVRQIILDMTFLGGGYIINPRLLRLVFYKNLQLKISPNNKMNKPLARSAAEVFACLCNQYFEAGQKFKVETSFFVAQSVWDKYLIGRKEIESGIKFLKRIKLIEYYNYCLHYNKKRRVRMYQINFNTLDKVYESAERIRMQEEEEIEDKREKEEEFQKSYFTPYFDRGF